MPPIKISKLVVLPFEEEAMSLSGFHYCFCNCLCLYHCHTFNPSLCRLFPFHLQISLFRACHLSNFSLTGLVNVWTVCQKSGYCREVGVSGGLTV